MRKRQGTKSYRLNLGSSATPPSERKLRHTSAWWITCLAPCLRCSQPSSHRTRDQSNGGFSGELVQDRDQLEERWRARFHEHSRAVPGSPVGFGNLAEQSCWKPWQQRSVGALLPGDDGSRPILGKSQSGSDSRGARSETSDLGVGQTSGLVTHAAPRDERWQDSAPPAARTGVLGRNRTLR